MSILSDFLFETRIAASSLADYVTGTGLRLGVTGLSRARVKTVFITALVQNLLRASTAAKDGERALPVFRVHAEGRLMRAKLQPQPDDHVPRFAYEDHLAALTGGANVDERHWPESTRRISELRLTLEFERRKGPAAGPSELTIDIVDYPGEWLLDLPLLTKSYAQWSRETLESESAAAARAPFAADWRGATLAVAADRARKRGGGQAPRGTLHRLPARRTALTPTRSPPCRPAAFLMPGELEGSPALTFAPLHVEDDTAFASGSLAAMMERRYEAYKAHVVKPFFRDHFARLDRQIVLVDALSALNSGPAAVRDLETALSEILVAFRAGRSGFSPRSSVRRSTASCLRRPRPIICITPATTGWKTSCAFSPRARSHAPKTSARMLTSWRWPPMRATREAKVKQGRLLGEKSELDAIVGVPLPGERIDGETFDGKGRGRDLSPANCPPIRKQCFAATDSGRAQKAPPTIASCASVRPSRASRKTANRCPLPSIRLDRALEFLLGDRLQ